MRRSRFAGVGASTPARVVPNAELERRFGVDEGWIRSRTGVEERRVLGPDESLLDLAAGAARAALENAGTEPEDLDAIVVATTSGNESFPSLACRVHQRLELSRIPAFDVAAACAGFPYALTVADQSIRAGDYDRVLVIGADRLHSCCDPGDRGTSSLFGDGAGAVILEANDEGEAGPGILSRRLRAIGELGDILRLPTGARTADAIPPGRSGVWMEMQGAEVFRAAVEQLVDLSREVLDDAGFEPSAVSLLVPHQANLRIIRMMLSQLGIARDRAAVNLDRLGNTSAASIPIALADAWSDGRLSRGDLVLLNAVGGGITVGAVLARW